MRYNYWTSSKLVKWIRAKIGIQRPTFATRANWKKWREDYKNQHEFFYKVTEVWPNKIQDFIFSPIDLIDKFYYYLNARFKDKYYSLSSTLDKGSYHEIDNRMLYCNFQTLVNFVEIEQASSQTYVHDDKKKQKEINKLYGVKWYHRNRWIALFMPHWRSREAGLKHFEWECNLKIDEGYCGYERGEMTEEQKAEYPNFGQLTPQAQKAIQILNLYNWWVIVRPARPDPMEASGWNERYNKLMDRVNNDVMDFLDIREDEDKKVSETMWKLEEQYEKEDEEKLIELIKIRRSLWT